METQYTRLSMTPSGVPPVIYMSQNDIGRPIGFICDADLSDYSVVLEATRTDGTPITVAATVDGNICAFETTATMTNKADVYIAQIVVTNASGKHISSIPIKCVVILAAMNENSEGIEEDAPLYQQYTGTVQSLIADIRTQLNAEASARQAADNQLQSNINAEASTRATQDASLQSQINQLIAPSGSAPSAAEVENARVGADGTVYPTLGDAIRGQVTDVKSAINEEIGYDAEVIPTITFDDGYMIMASGSTVGNVIANPNNSTTKKIPVGTAKKYTFYYTDQSPFGSIFFYDANDGYIFHRDISTSQNQEVIPSGTSYICFYGMTSRKSNIHFALIDEIEGRIYQTLDTKLDKNQGTENSGKFLLVDESGNITPTFINDAKKQYMVDAPQKPLLAEMMADFAWCSMVIPSAFTQKNVSITVSGTSGSNELTASSISPDTLSISDIGTDWVGGVLSADGVNFSICNFKYISGSKIQIYPALTESITDGILSTLMYDSGATYVGLHLTENGYKAYAQNLYRKNPKHCEVGKFVARFRADQEDPSPFVWYGGNITPEAYRFTKENLNMYWLNRPSKKAYTFAYSPQWTPHNTKSGAYWDVNLNGRSGYLEAFIFPIAPVLLLPSGQEIHVVVTIDGTVKLNTVLTDSICKRIIVDYDNATTGRIEIYSDKWQAIDGSPYGFGIGRITWWVNELYYNDNVMFPKGAVIAQEFDSWGVFHNGASGIEMERLHSDASGVSVPYTNHSLGDQTSAWGKAWFYENVWKHHPKMCIHDFVINDTNSITNAGIPDTIQGPDGKSYNNKLTQEDYSNNMKLLGQLAISNGIQPIFMRNCQSGTTVYHEFTNALIDSMSEQI